MAQKIYSKGSLFVDGQPIAEVMKFDLKYATNSNSVQTIEQGQSGESPGAFSTMLNITSAVPTAGLDIDYIKTMIDMKLVSFVVFARGKKIKGSGFIKEASEEYGVGSQSFTCSISCGVPEESVL